MAEGLLIGVILALRNLSDFEIAHVLRGESPRLEVTKSLLNILHNIVTVGSILLTKRQKESFRTVQASVEKLLGSKTTLSQKRGILLQHPALVKALASACPPMKLDK